MTTSVILQILVIGALVGACYLLWWIDRIPPHPDCPVCQSREEDR